MPETAAAATLLITEPTEHVMSSGVPDAGDATNGNSFVNTGREVLVVDNVGASSRTIQFRNEDSDAAIGSAVTIAANAMAVLGPFDPKVYGTRSATGVSSVAFLPSHADLNFRVFDITRTKNLITSKR